MAALPNVLHKKPKKMEKTVTTKYLRTSVKKLRILLDACKNQKAIVLLEKLSLQPQKASLLIASTLKSGINLFQESDRENLKVKAISADQGPVFKRWRAGSRGMAKKYSKKTAHLQITLEVPNSKIKKNGK